VEVVVKSSDRASVLIVDDNHLIRSVIQKLFQCEHFDVQTATNGVEALSVLEHDSFDVIICDVMMPEMDGYEFFNSVRNNDLHAHIPFVFLTALDSHDELKKGWQSGCDGYFTKPFDPELLISTVKGKVSRSRNIKKSVDDNQDRFRKRVLHTLSHEFRTPLVAINTGTEILLDDIQLNGEDENSKSKRLLEAIHRGGLRLERLVNDFMLLQQIEAGIAHGLFEKKSQPCSVNTVVSTFLSSIESLVSENGFRVQTSILCPDKKINIYEPQVVEALKRIADNAVKFSGANKMIEVAAYCTTEEVIISIADSGIGMDPSKIKNSIGAFTQVDRDKFEQQGSGLGLAIAHRYAEINKSQLEFLKREQGGAVVSLHIPLAHCPN